MRGTSKMLSKIKKLLNRTERSYSKARVTVTYERHIEESDVDITDLLKSPDNITGIGKLKINHWKAPI